MKQLFIFIGGMIAGALLLFCILYLIGRGAQYSEREQLRQQLIDKISQEPEIQYVEVKGKKGIVTLHTGMSKDSVQILLGKPDEVNLRTVLNSSHEDWGYKIHDKYGLSKELQIPDLTLDFVDGKLEGVRQD